MADWTCRCGARNAELDRYCEGCSAENSKAPRHISTAQKPPETSVPWVAPTYPEPAPGDDALIRAEIARARKLLGMAEGASDRLGLPRVEPAIRAELARRNASGPEPVGALVAEVLGRAMPKRATTRPEKG